MDRLQPCLDNALSMPQLRFDRNLVDGGPTLSQLDNREVEVGFGLEVKAVEDFRSATNNYVLDGKPYNLAQLDTLLEGHDVACC